MSLKTCELYVEGMHCAACEILVEDKVGENPSVKFAKASLNDKKVKIDLDIDSNLDTILPQLNSVLSKHGYTLVKEKPQQKINVKLNFKAFLIAFGIMTLFLFSQKLGIINFFSSAEVTYSYVFIIGVIASLSTCMAVVGGLVLSLSTTYKKVNKSTSKPMLNFHIARLLGFFIFGGLIGLLGATLPITPTVTFIISIALFVVMLMLGLNMLDIVPNITKMHLRLPTSIGKYIMQIQTNENTFTPYLLGALTFFLPCGFTQSMQFYAVTTGSFTTGALTMLTFALGTLPVLASISFLSDRFANGLNSKLFYLTAGYLIIFFAFLNFYGALTAAGFVNPIINF